MARRGADLGAAWRSGHGASECVASERGQSSDEVKAALAGQGRYAIIADNIRVKEVKIDDSGDGHRSSRRPDTCRAAPYPTGRCERLSLSEWAPDGDPPQDRQLSDGHTRLAGGDSRHPVAVCQQQVRRLGRGDAPRTRHHRKAHEINDMSLTSASVSSQPALRERRPYREGCGTTQLTLGLTPT